MDNIFLIIIGIILLFILFKLVKSKYERDKYKDFFNKEPVYKIALYKEIKKHIENLNKNLSQDTVVTLATGILMIYINQNLRDLKTAIDVNFIEKEAIKLFSDRVDIKDLVITYLRTKSTFIFIKTDELWINPNQDSPTNRLLMSFGKDIPAINDYSDFYNKFNKFMKNKW